MAEWFERFPAEWWIGNEDHVTESHVTFICKTLRLRRGQCVLDAPCGDGQVSVGLARRGLHVTGVDITKKFISRAHRRFRKERLRGTFHVMDLRRMDSVAEFHAVCNWFNSFGYFSDRENLDVLRRFAQALKRGGRLLIDQTNREYMRRHPIPHYRYEDFVRTTRWDQESERYEMTWSRLFDGKELWETIQKAQKSALAQSRIGSYQLDYHVIPELFQELGFSGIQVDAAALPVVLDDSRNTPEKKRMMIESEHSAALEDLEIGLRNLFKPVPREHVEELRGLIDKRSRDRMSILDEEKHLWDFHVSVVLIFSGEAQPDSTHS